MKTQNTLPPNQENESFGTATREVITSLKEVIRSEMQLAKAELDHTTANLKSHVVQAVVFGVIAALGVLPLIAFLVIGLGKLLNNQYWLSSLIVGVVFIGFGGALAFRAFKKMKSHDVSFPHTRTNAGRDVNEVRQKISEISETISDTMKGRAA